MFGSHFFGLLSAAVPEFAPLPRSRPIRLNLSFRVQVVLAWLVSVLARQILPDLLLARRVADRDGVGSLFVKKARRIYLGYLLR